ncbi:hypothetical protein CONLIGDRAFT_206742 [Coniochaeta ligniaria NRRL 30616]|uniref:Uncharacterized protein n=1 Tax=Coniochaeta ligniaria NRRL 30616 TaxID=1408157 RepID=A0A1J7J2N5_9PEZI|nr:hypothetical protein CONLIGDRAFT_206742 [Coniochaeta ligniaria NRRL 30616]
MSYPVILAFDPLLWLQMSMLFRPSPCGLAFFLFSFSTIPFSFESVAAGHRYLELFRSNYSTKHSWDLDAHTYTKEDEYWAHVVGFLEHPAICDILECQEGGCQQNTLALSVSPSLRGVPSA